MNEKEINSGNKSKSVNITFTRDEEDSDTRSSETS